MNALFTGLLFGCAVAAPVGPISLLCLRRTIAGGFLLGFASGLGAACADGAYAGLAVAALGVATAALAHVSMELHILGGVALTVLGLRTALTARQMAQAGTTSHVRNRRGVAGAFASTLLLTIVNPATIVSFVAVIAASGSYSASAFESALFVAGVTVGSAAWWLALCAAAAALRRSFTPAAIRGIDLTSGVVLVGWGFLSVIRR